MGGELKVCDDFKVKILKKIRVAKNIYKYSNFIT